MREWGKVVASILWFRIWELDEGVDEEVDDAGGFGGEVSDWLY